MLPPTVLAVAGWLLIRRTTTESKVDHVRRFDVVGHASWAIIALGVLAGLTVAQVAGEYAAAVGLASLIVVGLGIGLLIWWEINAQSAAY